MDHSISDHVFNHQSLALKKQVLQTQGPCDKHAPPQHQEADGGWSPKVIKSNPKISSSPKNGGNSRTCVQWSPSLVMRRQLSFDVSMLLKKQLYKELIFVEKWVMSWWLFSPAKGSNWICTILWGSLLLIPADFSCGAAGRKFSQNHTGSDATMTLSVCIFMISYDVILYYVRYIYYVKNIYIYWVPGKQRQ